VLKSFEGDQIVYWSTIEILRNDEGIYEYLYEKHA
jgi:hypothetical protein